MDSRKGSQVLFFTYAVALFSTLVAFGLLFGGGSGLTGAYVYQHPSCSLGGSLSCKDIVGDGNSFLVTVSNELNEPIVIRSTRIGACSATPVDIRLEIGAQEHLLIDHCLSRRPNNPAIFEVYTEGVLSGKTQLASGRLAPELFFS